MSERFFLRQHFQMLGIAGDEFAAVEQAVGFGQTCDIETLYELI